MFLISDIIGLTIQIERNAENVYRKAQQKVTDSTLILILQWLAAEEVNHTRRFANLKQNLETHANPAALEEMGKALLSDVLGNQSFSLEDTDFSEINQIEELLGLVIEFEKDKVTFYSMLQGFIEDKKTLKFLDTIIAEENNHIKRLQRFIDCAAQEDEYKLADNVQ